MTFTVTYRGADGAPVTEAVEAASRAECLAQMKARGVAVLGVKEGGRKSDVGRRMSDGKGGSRKPSKRKGHLAVMVVALAVLAAGIGIWWMVGRRGEEVAPQEDIPKKTALAKEVKPAAAPKPLQTPIQDTNSAPKVSLAYLKDLSPEERRAEIRRLNEEKPIDLTQPTNRIFATGTEQVMAWIITTNLGEMPPLLPSLPNFELAHLQEILEHRNVVLDGDDEKTEDAKRTVDAAKEYLKAYIEKGGDPQKFLQFYRDELQQAFETRIAAQKQVMQVIREEPEIAAAFIDEVNAELDKKKIKHVRIPPPLRERLGLK